MPVGRHPVATICARLWRRGARSWSAGSSLTLHHSVTEAWLAQIGYSIVTMDVFVFLANCFGVLIGLYFTLIAYGYSTDKVMAYDNELERRCRLSKLP